MPYLNAFSKELLCKHPPTYFSLTHAVTEPVKLVGYNIPTSARIKIFLPTIFEDPKLWKNLEKFDPNMSARIKIFLPTIFEDPKLWKNLEKFDPNRFLSGGEDADIISVIGIKMIPFGVGQRICPGLGMTTLHVNLMLAKMVQEFEWSAYAKNNGKIDFGEKLKFTVVMENDLRAKIKRRV